VLGVHIDGGLRERIVVPAAKLHPSPTLGFEELAVVETLCIGAHAVARAAVEPGEWALVIGAGPIGLGVMRFAAQAGARVIALDVNAARLDFCRDVWGVDATIAGGEGSDGAWETVRDLTEGDLPTVVFDATGHGASMCRAFDFVAPSGRLVFVGLCRDDITFSDPDFHRKELTILATRNALPADFKAILAGMETGKIDTAPWVTHRAPLGMVPHTFEGWTDPRSGVLKAVIAL
jgi:threonine dehydrogenase-like Zn-dependent dehydrogenase